MRIFILLLFMAACLHVSAQDNIFLNNGTIITGKVIEISNKEVQYKTSDNANGPMYVESRRRIKKILYENGKQEIFSRDSILNNRFMEEDMARNAVYFELVGNSISGVSLNFDYTFYRTPMYGISGRLGIAPEIFDDHRFVAVPMTVSLLFGQRGSFELGFGFTTVNYDVYDNSSWIYPRTKKNITKILPTGIIGFRYQSKDKLFVKMAFTPVYFSEVDYNQYNGGTFPAKSKGIYNTLGFGLGYGF